jgi:single-strand DNA-binding protein
MFNKAILMGRICTDLEVKTTPGGVTVLSFRIAVDRKYQSKESPERKTDFFNVVAWRQTAEYIAKFFGKGRMILLEGELQTRQYVDRNGQNRDVVELVVDTWAFTGESKQQSAGYQNDGEYAGNQRFTGNQGGSQTGYQNNYRNNNGTYQQPKNAYGGGDLNEANPAYQNQSAPKPAYNPFNADNADNKADSMISSSADDDDYPF